MPEIEMNSRDRMNTRTSPPSSQTGTMQRSQIAGFLILVISAVVFALTGPLPGHPHVWDHLDFKALYYGTNCLIANQNAYDPATLDRFFISAGAAHPNDPPYIREVVDYLVYFPFALLFVAPFALLPWSTAYILWTFLIFAAYCFACFLIWTATAPHSRVLSALLIGILLTSGQTILVGGNAVGIVVGLSGIAAWCFIRHRYEWAGVLALAFALVLKPHDAGFIWLFFLLAGKTYRRRALQTFAVTAVFALFAAGWAFRVIPDWPKDQHNNLVALAGLGGNPSPNSSVERTGNMLVNLQTIVAVFHNSPPFYNLVTYMLCGIPLLLWALHIYRTSPTGNAAWFALAAVVPLEMLITYHKPYDLKLLLLLLPACFLLWAENSTRGQAAFLLTAGALFFTADLPFAVYNALTRPVPMDLHSLAAQLKIVFLLRPIPLILIALAAFYLTIFLRQRFPAAAGGLTTGQQPDAAHTPT